MAVFTPLSAKNAKVRIGTFVLTAFKWTVTPKCDELDITNFEAGGFGDWIGGVIDAEFTIECDWDSANDPFANPPNLVPTAIISAGIKLYTNDTTSPFWNFPSSLCVETPQTAEVRGKLGQTFRFKSKGSFTTP